MFTMKQIAHLILVALISSTKIQAQCNLKPDGSYGNKSETSVVVQFDYELEYDPQQLLNVSMSVVPALERSFNKAVLLTLFPNDCKEAIVNDFNVIGISASPEDSVLPDVTCSPMFSDSNACEVVNAALTVYFRTDEEHSKIDIQEKAQDITDLVLESLRYGMEETKFILSISMKRVSFYGEPYYPQEIRDSLEAPLDVKNSQELSQGAKDSQELSQGAKGSQELSQGAKGSQELSQGAKGSQELSQGVKGSQELSQDVSNLYDHANNQESREHQALVNFLIVLPFLIIAVFVIYCYFRKKKTSRKGEKDLKKEDKDYCWPQGLHMEDEASSVASGGLAGSHTSDEYTSDYTNDVDDASECSYDSANISTTSSDGLFSYYSALRPIRQTSTSTNGDESISSRARFREIVDEAVF